jgi:hypothetical protein
MRPFWAVLGGAPPDCVTVVETTTPGSPASPGGTLRGLPDPHENKKYLFLFLFFFKIKKIKNKKNNFFFLHKTFCFVSKCEFLFAAHSSLCFLAEKNALAFNALIFTFLSF